MGVSVRHSVCICLLSLVMHAKMLQSSLILYARNEKTFYDRIILVGTYIFRRYSTRLFDTDV